VGRGICPMERGELWKELVKASSMRRGGEQVPSRTLGEVRGPWMERVEGQVLWKEGGRVPWMGQAQVPWMEPARVPWMRQARVPSNELVHPSAKQTPVRKEGDSDFEI